ncbi:MAG TPA: hypothetical protein VJS64_12395 [Pyrinomonadaceae bacterium]|nr:hypothetical protein [Pyrinomonadaceae bacterium]
MKANAKNDGINLQTDVLTDLPVTVEHAEQAMGGGIRGAGDDVLVGGDGPHALYGGAGLDILIGNTGGDR